MPHSGTILGAINFANYADEPPYRAIRTRVLPRQEEIAVGLAA